MAYDFIIIRDTWSPTSYTLSTFVPVKMIEHIGRSGYKFAKNKPCHLGQRWPKVRGCNVGVAPR